MSEATVGDELTRLQEAPSLGIPRETMLALAMSARGISGALRELREQRGRASWNEADEAARIHLAADAASIDRLTMGQAHEWNERVSDGAANLWSTKTPGGLVLADAGLSDGTHVVQATLGDRTVTVAAGSAATASHLREWLAGNPTHDSLDDLRSAANDVASSRRIGLSSTQGMPAAADQPANVGEQAAETGTATASLRDRLDGRLPDAVFADKRWPVAERTFADLVERGVDPGTLTEAAAGLKIDARVRTPAGLVAWQLRRTAQGHTGATDEEQARREAASEWLTGAADTPPDRARASTLVGQIDDDFDRRLAQKYPGILTSDPEGQWHDHNGRAKSETDRAAQHDDAARLSEERVDDGAVSVMHGPTVEGEDEHSQATDHEHYAADERHAMANAEGARAHDAANPTEAAASAPLSRNGPTPAGSHRTRTGQRPATTRPVTQTPTRNRARTR